jgi:hypothetical protein
MTKEEAAVKVRKIIAHARGSSNDNERQVAINQAKRLMEEHNLTADEIDNQAYLDAYEEIAKEVAAFSSKTPIVEVGFFGNFDIIGELVNKSKEHLPTTYKVGLVKKLKQNKSVVLLLLGSKYQPLLDRIDTILKNHNL